MSGAHHYLYGMKGGKKSPPWLLPAREELRVVAPGCSGLSLHLGTGPLNPPPRAAESVTRPGPPSKPHLHRGRIGLVLPVALRPFCLQGPKEEGLAGSWPGSRMSGEPPQT